MANKYSYKFGWSLFDRVSFIEVVPAYDTEEHFLGDECWCDPDIEIIVGDPDKMIVHHAKDGREQFE